MHDLLSPTDFTAFMRDAEAQTLIRELSDYDLDDLADALTGALTLARNEICLRDMRGEESK